MNDRNNNRHGHSSIRVEETNKTRPQYARCDTHLPQTGHHDGEEDNGVELLVPSSLFSTQLTQISDEDGNHADGAYAAHQESNRHHHHHSNKGIDSFTVKHSSAARKRKHASILLAPDDETQVYIPEDKTEEEEDSGIEDSKGLDNADAEDGDRHGWTTQISSFGIKDVDETSPRHASRITSAAASTLTTATAAHSSPAYYRTTSSLLDTIMMLSDEPSIGETPCVMIKKKGGGKATTAMQQQQLQGKQRAAYRRRQRAQEVEKGEEAEDGTNTVSKRGNRNEVVAGSSDDGDYDSGSSNQNNNNSSNNKSNYYNIVASSSVGAGAVHLEGGQHIPQSPMSPSIRRVRLERLQELEKKRNAMLRQRQRREQQALEKKRQLLLQQQKLVERKQVGENKQQKIIKKAVRAEVQKRKNDESSDESFSEDDDCDDEDDEQVSANEDYESINKQGEKEGEEGWWCRPRATRGRKGSRYILTAPPVSNFIGNETGAHNQNYERDWKGGNDFDEEEARDRRRVHALLFGETRCQVINCGDSTILPRGRHQYHIGESCENNEQEGETAKPSRSEFSVSPPSKHTTGQSGNNVLAPASRCNTSNSAMRILAYDNPRVVVVPMALSNNAPVSGKPVFVKPAPRGNVRQKCRKRESEGKSSEEEKRGTVEEKAKNGREAEVKKKRDMNVNKGWWARPANVGFYDIGHLIFSDHTKGVDDHRLEDGQAASGSRVDTSGGEVCLAGGGGMATKRPRVETSASVVREGSLRSGRDRGSGGGRRSRRTFEPADFISLTRPLLASDVTLVGLKSFDFSAI